MTSRRERNFLHPPQQGKKTKKYSRSYKKAWRIVRVGRALTVQQKKKRMKSRVTYEGAVLWEVSREVTKQSSLTLSLKI